MGTPDLSAFPRRAWLAAIRQVLNVLPHEALGYGDPGGVPELAAELAAYLGRVRAADAPAARLVVVNGVAQGLDLVIRALARTGPVPLAVEDPHSERTHALLGAAGAVRLPIPVDGQGIDVGALRRGPARVVLVTPAHQYPTGVVLSPRRRAELIAWAAEVDGLVLEDDYDAEFRYDRDPVGCLQGLCPQRVVLLGSVSKSLAPGLRLGWLVAPPPLAEAVRRARAQSDLGSPVIDQYALARLIASGAYDRHLRQMRRRYRARRDAMVEALARWLPGATVHGVSAGIQLYLELPPASTRTPSSGRPPSAASPSRRPRPCGPAGTGRRPSCSASPGCPSTASPTPSGSWPRRRRSRGPRGSAAARSRGPGRRRGDTPSPGGRGRGERGGGGGGASVSSLGGGGGGEGGAQGDRHSGRSGPAGRQVAGVDLADDPSCRWDYPVGPTPCSEGSRRGSFRAHADPARSLAMASGPTALGVDGPAPGTGWPAGVDRAGQRELGEHRDLAALRWPGPAGDRLPSTPPGPEGTRRAYTLGGQPGTAFMLRSRDLPGPVLDNGQRHQPPGPSAARPARRTGLALAEPAKERGVPVPYGTTRRWTPARRRAWRPHLDELARRHQVPGASLAVLAGGEVATLATGVLHKGTGVEVTTDSLFQIGSMTNAYTATVVLALVDQGLAGVDTPVAELLPGFRVADPEVSRR